VEPLLCDERPVETDCQTRSGIMVHAPATLVAARATALDPLVIVAVFLPLARDPAGSVAIFLSHVAAHGGVVGGDAFVKAEPTRRTILEALLLGQERRCAEHKRGGQRQDHFHLSYPSSR